MIFSLCIQLVIHNNPIIFCCNTLHFSIKYHYMLFRLNYQVFPKIKSSELWHTNINIYTHICTIYSTTEVINEIVTSYHTQEIPCKIRHKNSYINLQLTRRMEEAPGGHLIQPPAQAVTPGTGYPGPWPDRSWVSPKRETPNLSGQPVLVVGHPHC